MPGVSETSHGLDRLCTKAGKRWKAIDDARAQTLALRQTLAERMHRLTPADTSLVTFGSIARQEYSQGSDVDWTLLVDGQADPAHVTAAQAIRKELVALHLQEPGATGTFGSTTFSHFDSEASFAPLVQHLRSVVGIPPIDILADAFCDHATISTGIQYFDAYARFLELLSAGAKREHLEQLKAEHAHSDALFKEIRDLADATQHSLNSLFFDDDKLRELTLKYGLF